jgi:transposase
VVREDKLDAQWLARLTETGLLQPSFVPPYDIRRLREFTRLRAELVHEKSRYWARLEKLLERALIKISAVASTLDTDSCRAMIEALIAGQRNPRVIAELAIGKMQPKRAALAEALDGDFQPHHGELARLLLDQIDALADRDRPAVRAGHRAGRRDPRRLGRGRRRGHRPGRRRRPGCRDRAGGGPAG